MFTKFTCDIGGTLISQHKSAPELDAKLISYDFQNSASGTVRVFHQKNAFPAGNSAISKKEIMS
jgi:hypothetical protein